MLSPTEKQQFLQQGAIFARNDQVWLMWGYKSPVKRQSPAVAVIDFFLEQPISWQAYRHSRQVLRQDLQGLFQPADLHLPFEEASYDSFQRQFDWIQKQIVNEKLTKAVPYVFERASIAIESSHRESLLAAALQVSSGYLYGYWDQKQGLLGITPERLFLEKQKNQFQTMALAGTMDLEKFKKNPQTFFDDKKETMEHQWVVEDIKSQLNSCSAFQQSDLQVLETPHLAHLQTQFDFQLTADTSFTELVKLLHPTPALGCAPRAMYPETMSALNKIEPRHFFGAPFGFMDESGRWDCVVAIRNLIWEGEKLYLGSGCGVVKQSQLDKEWAELKLKRQSVKRMFNLR